MRAAPHHPPAPRLLVQPALPSRGGAGWADGFSCMLSARTRTPVGDPACPLQAHVAGFVHPALCPPPRPGRALTRARACLLCAALPSMPPCPCAPAAVVGAFLLSVVVVFIVSRRPAGFSALLGSPRSSATPSRASARSAHSEAEGARSPSRSPTGSPPLELRTPARPDVLAGATSGARAGGSTGGRSGAGGAAASASASGGGLGWPRSLGRRSPAASTPANRMSLLAAEGGDVDVDGVGLGMQEV
jgi:hypothetical protein